MPDFLPTELANEGASRSVQHCRRHAHRCLRERRLGIGCCDYPSGAIRRAEQHGEVSASPWARAHLDSRAVLFQYPIDNRLDNRQPEPRARGGARDEGTEQAVDLANVHAAPGVFELDPGALRLAHHS